MNVLIKIVIPDAGPINSLAAAGLLHLLLAPKNCELVVIKSVLNEILMRAPEFNEFLSLYADRIQIISTSICQDDAQKRMRGEPVGKGRGDLAIADFILNHIDEAVRNVPALVIFEDKKLGRLRDIDAYSENTHFITTAAYLRKLEQEGIINSFEDIWRQVVVENHVDNPSLHRNPNPDEIDFPAQSGSSIFRHIG